MKIEIRAIEPAFEGRSFGAIGPYEKITGRAFAAVDPAHRLNRNIVNLDRAPRDSGGRVEYWADFCLLKPADMAKANRRLLFDVPNRGNKLLLVDLNDAPRGPGSNSLASAADAGNGFLMGRGYTMLFGAWQGDVPAGEHRMLAGLPVARNGSNPIVAMAREEFIFNAIGGSMAAPLSYPAANPDQRQATLTVRAREGDPHVPLSHGDWRYLSESQIEITPARGFDAGAIYEFIYPARDPIVMGLGFAAIRDLAAFFRHDATDETGQGRNPLVLGGGPAIDHVIAHGRSQPGRVLRDFVYLGFNEDLDGRKVFDGVMATVPGSRRSFINYAFAQPGRFSRQHEDRLFPGDQFPFTYATRTDSISGRTDGILARAQASGTCPRIMHIDSSSEYWQARASLVIADERGNDIELPEEVRVYLFAGTQHAGALMAADNSAFAQNPGNPLNYNSLNRALLVALDDWATRGLAPPAGRHPGSRDGTLVPPVPQSRMGFPTIPGVTYSGIVNELSELDYSHQPPRPIPGHDYAVLVPKVDSDGNEIAGIRLPEIAVPTATRTGWNLRRAGFGEGDLVLAGSCIPFAATAAQRQALGDPRPSLEERYPTHEAYVEKVAAAARALREERLLLDEDVARYIAQARESRVGK